MLIPNFRHSEGSGRRKLLTYDEVMRMDRSKMLVMVNGQQMLMLDKFDYTRNPESAKLKPISVRGLAQVAQAPCADEAEAMTALDAFSSANTETEGAGNNRGADSKGKKPAGAVSSMQRGRKAYKLAITTYRGPVFTPTLTAFRR